MHTADILTYKYQIQRNHHLYAFRYVHHTCQSSARRPPPLGWNYHSYTGPWWVCLIPLQSENNVCHSYRYVIVSTSQHKTTTGGLKTWSKTRPFGHVFSDIMSCSCTLTMELLPGNRPHHPIPMPYRKTPMVWWWPPKMIGTGTHILTMELVNLQDMSGLLCWGGWGVSDSKECRHELRLQRCHAHHWLAPCSRENYPQPQYHSMATSTQCALRAAAQNHMF